ncbi:MAG: hypothetical protein IKO55_07045, partial [Kiritimatiellae bacterium]|nr:hypothetical protein [Kiritimatiellia bacterium]
MKKKSGKALKKGPRNGGTIGVNHILTSMKENPAGAAIIWLVFLFITGIGNAVFGNQFGYCATAIKDTSRTTALKFVNAYYIHAAKFELTDIFVFPALLLVEVFIVLLWYS